MADGFLLVDKPTAWTSHDVVGKLRRIVGMKRVGHAGTLDPMATGLLVVGLGKATRLLRFIQEFPKEYVATIMFGAATDSGDADGDIVDEVAASFDEKALGEALGSFVGTVYQVPPQVSAIKRGGKRLHKLARAGVAIELEPRPVTIHEIELLDLDIPRATMRVACGKGTYIRVLADDIAKAVGTRGHLTALRRTRNGSLSVDEAHTIEDLEAADDPMAAVISLADGLRDMPVLEVPAEQSASARHGAAIDGVGAVGEELVGVVDGEDLIGVYRAEGGRLVPEVVVA